VTFWCAISSAGITGHCFFEDCEKRVRTVSAEQHKPLVDYSLKNSITVAWLYGLQQDEATVCTVWTRTEVSTETHFLLCKH